MGKPWENPWKMVVFHGILIGDLKDIIGYNLMEIHFFVVQFLWDGMFGWSTLLDIQ